MRIKKKCIAPDCETIVIKGGRECSKHRTRRWKYGDYNFIKPTWANLKKGQRQLTRYGYYRIHINGKRVLEHRYVMEQHLGRKLTLEEKVHHINHIRNDNRIENLELFSSHSKHILTHHIKKPLINWTNIKVPPKTNRWHPNKYTKCLVENCQDKIETRSLCFKHFVSWRRNSNQF